MARSTKWTDEVKLYIIDCYAGVEMVEAHGMMKPMRHFLWADATGEVWLGNGAAFALHLSERFGFAPAKYDYVTINSILLDLGERIHPEQARRKTGDSVGQQPLQPRKERAR